MSKDQSYQNYSDPPSYESVMQGSPNKPISTTFPVDTIGQSTYTQPAFAPSAPSAPQPDYSGSVGTITEVTVTQPSQPLLNLDVCPVCRIGVLESDFSCIGICLAIFCFPIGILCCLACKNKRCSQCGTII